MRRGRRGTTPPAGVIAWFDGTCPICDGLIQRLVSMVVKRKQDWVHADCHSRTHE